jgi:hypothetical protein
MEMLSEAELGLRVGEKLLNHRSRVEGFMQNKIFTNMTLLMQTAD